MDSQDPRMEDYASTVPSILPCTPMMARKTNLFATAQHPSTQLQVNTQLWDTPGEHYHRFNRQLPSSPTFGSPWTSTPPSSSSSTYLSSSPLRQPNSSPPSSP